MYNPSPFHVLRFKNLKTVAPCVPVLTIPLYKESAQFKTPCQTNLNAFYVPWNEEAIRCGGISDDKGNRYLVFSRAWERARPKFDFSQRLDVTTTPSKDGKKKAAHPDGFEYYDSFDPFFSCEVSPLENLMTASHANYYVCVKLPSKLNRDPTVQ
jgi:hypothetical protein